MTRIPITPIQQPANCKWTRLADRQSGIPTYNPEHPRLWVCVRRAGARPRVVETDCERCPQWEIQQTVPCDW